jgi:hypothetical protein
MVMILRFGLAALASAFLLGCQTTPPEQQWTKSGASVDDVKRDLYWCSTVKRAPPGPSDTPATQREASVSVNDDCMESRGYQKAPRKS